MIIFDCFTFFNELDLLEFRLKLLDSTVDKFVICESNITFSGKPKPYYFEENMARYDKWMHKIIYLPIEQTTEGIEFRQVTSYSPDNGPFLLEHQQRNSLSYANEYIEDNDLVLIGDLDEIPDPNSIKAISKIGVTSPISLSMLFHYYYMNCQVLGYDRIWSGTIACPGDYFKNTTPQYLRDNRNHLPKLPASGWHFSYLGGVEKVKTKIQSFAHTEFNRPDITSEDNISKAIENGTDVFNRPGVSYKLVGLEEYPDFLKDLMIQYPQFVKYAATIDS